MLDTVCIIMGTESSNENAILNAETSVNNERRKRMRAEMLGLL